MKAFVAFCVFAAMACLAVAQDEERPAPCTPPADCPTNEVFSCSAYVCQPTCADPKAEKCAECNRMLGVRKACVCANGLIRLYDYGPCVSPRKCSYISPAPGPVIAAY